ncbi:MAG: hypothetical protein PVG30_08460, partial [Gammaproteobacteria bacterium]
FDSWLANSPFLDSFIIFKEVNLNKKGDISKLLNRDILKLPLHKNENFVLFVYLSIYLII